MKAKKKPAKQYWRPAVGAVVYGCPDAVLTAKKFKTRGTAIGWVTLYKGRKQVWDCNAEFFKAHFFRVEGPR